MHSRPLQITYRPTGRAGRCARDDHGSYLTATMMDTNWGGPHTLDELAAIILEPVGWVELLALPVGWTYATGSVSTTGPLETIVDPTGRPVATLDVDDTADDGLEVWTLGGQPTGTIVATAADAVAWLSKMTEVAR